MKRCLASVLFLVLVQGCHLTFATFESSGIDAGQFDAHTSDADTGPGTDSGRPDSGPDAGRPGDGGPEDAGSRCPTDCDDGDPCTTDTCGSDSRCSNDLDPLCPTDVLAAGPGRTDTPGGHSCVLHINGEVSCWGNNSYGQLGNGSATVTHLTPTRVSSLPDATAIRSFSYHTCAKRRSGRLSCWGLNSFGELGDGTETDRNTPATVMSISVASDFDAGTGHTCAVEPAGTVRCWGYNLNGQLGDGSMSNRSRPVLVAGLSGAVEQVATGDHHTCALLTSGQVECWGLNNRGQLGTGSTAPASSPSPLPVSGLVNAVELAAGQNHTCARTSGGTVRCWGEIMPLSLSPRLIPMTGEAASISAGSNHTCARLTSGGVRCWGNNSSGQLGDGTTTSRPNPVEATGVTDTIAISAGGTHTCALRASREVSCWGYNADGQLGDGTTTQRPVPTAVTVL